MLHRPVLSPLHRQGNRLERAGKAFAQSPTEKDDNRLVR